VTIVRPGGVDEAAALKVTGSSNAGEAGEKTKAAVVGAAAGLTVIGSDDRPCCPSLSVTVSVARYVPDTAYACVVFTPNPDVPSPKSHS
jgi:hypothetical protein